MEDILEVHWKTGEQRVVSPIVGEMSNSHGPDRQRLSNREPGNFERLQTNITAHSARNHQCTTNSNQFNNKKKH